MIRFLRRFVKIFKEDLDQRRSAVPYVTNIMTTFTLILSAYSLFIDNIFVEESCDHIVELYQMRFKYF